MLCSYRRNVTLCKTTDVQLVWYDESFPSLKHFLKKPDVYMVHNFWTRQQTVALVELVECLLFCDDRTVAHTRSYTSLCEGILVLPNHTFFPRINGSTDNFLIAFSCSAQLRSALSRQIYGGLVVPEVRFAIVALCRYSTCEEHNNISRQLLQDVLSGCH